MTNSIGLVYTENNTELLGPIRPGEVFDKTRQDNDVIDLTDVIYAEKWY